MTNQNPDEIRSATLVENTAQSVRNTLEALELNREHNTTRWIWELLQNARDASGDSQLVVSIQYEGKNLVFQHNGSGFTIEQICHLIYHGSTKAEKQTSTNTDVLKPIGQYGSGFLTTHLLSPTIYISGPLDDGTPFEFCLKREISSVKSLTKSMNRAWEEFGVSKSNETKEPEKWTRFCYPIDDDSDADKVVEKGLAELKKYAPFVMAFNKEFSQISIKSSDAEISFENSPNKELKNFLWEVTVKKCENDNKYLLSRGEIASVAVPLAAMGENSRKFMPIEDAPKIFVGFPLVGTENFNFPAIINSFAFTPTDGRDAIYLWSGDKEKNEKNQQGVEEACALLIHLIEFAATSKPAWRDIYVLATVPKIFDQQYVNRDKLEKCIKENIVEKIRHTPSVVNNFGKPMHPEDATFPLAKSREDVDILWNLLNAWCEYREKLPIREEAYGWCSALESWAGIYGESPSTLDEAMDIQKLAKIIHEKVDKKGKIKYLTKLLIDDVCPIEWLNKLHGYLKRNGLHHEVLEYRIVPNQYNGLDTISNLCHDQDIDDVLKDIAMLLDWNVREKLIHTGIDCLKDINLTTCLDSKFVVEELIKKHQKRAKDNADKPSKKFMKASVCLFSWIAKKNKWDLLDRFPVFADKDKGRDRKRNVFDLKEMQDGTPPLAPISVWVEGLGNYAALFPSRHILSKAFFKKVREEDIWKKLDEKKILKRNVIITKNEHIRLSNDEYTSGEKNDTGVEHKTSDTVSVTDIAFLVGENNVISRVGQSKKSARLFWCFLTEWLIKQDVEGLEIKNTECSCGETHDYYSAKWLEPLTKNMWVPLGKNKRSKMSAQSLANLLRNGENFLSENSEFDKFLNAIQISHLDLKKALLIPDEEHEKIVDGILGKILTVSEGNIEHLSHARVFMECLKNDDELPNIINKRRERTQMVLRNKELGEQVEKLVKGILEDKGFTVDYTGKGSDFEIEKEIYESKGFGGVNYTGKYSNFEVETEDDIGKVGLEFQNRKWLIEVKSTRKEFIRMSILQAKTASEYKDGYLLCIVPIESVDSLPEENFVRDNMRFVEKIGNHVAKLCEDFDDLVEQRDNITNDQSSEVNLEIGAEIKCVRVMKSLWESEGISFEKFSDQLV